MMRGEGRPAPSANSLPVRLVLLTPLLWRASLPGRRLKGTRGTRNFPRDALAYAKWLQRRSSAGLAGLRLIARVTWAVALIGSSHDGGSFLF